MQRFFAFGFMGILVACDPPAGEATDAGTSAAASNAPPPAPLASASATASAAPKADKLELLKFTMTSGIEKKEPKDTMKTAHPGDRVYAHLTVRNRTGETRPVRLVFRVDGEEHTSLSLDIVSSWSFRTWGYNTARPTDVGKTIVATAYDAQGNELASGKVAVVK